MKLKKAVLDNFRCFEHLEMDFGERLTVIVEGIGPGLFDALTTGNMSIEQPWSHTYAEHTKKPAESMAPSAGFKEPADLPPSARSRI